MALLISLVHATYHREGGVDEVVRAWFDTADEPGAIDYVIGADDDDPLGPDALSRPVRIVRGPADPHWSTAVRNWNLAAGIASGDLIMVIADDLFPRRGWDLDIRRICSGLDPRQTSFAVKVDDSGAPRDTRLRHPIVSRRYYDSFGLFDPRFHGMYCDDDITVSALWNAFIVDGRSVRLDHGGRPDLQRPRQRSRSKARANSRHEYQFGKMALHQKWSWWRRRVKPVMLPAGWAAGAMGRTTSRWPHRALALLSIFYYYAVVTSRSIRDMVRGLTSRLGRVR